MLIKEFIARLANNKYSFTVNDKRYYFYVKTRTDTNPSRNTSIIKGALKNEESLFMIYEHVKTRQISKSSYIACNDTMTEDILDILISNQDIRGYLLNRIRDFKLEEFLN